MSWVTGSRAVILPFYTIFVRLHLEQCPALGSSVQERHGHTGQSQWGAAKEVWAGAHVAWGGAEWATVCGLEKRRLGVTSVLPETTWGQRIQRNQSQTLLIGAQQQDERQWTQAGTWKLWLHTRRNVFHCESDKTLEQITQRDCGIPDLGGVQDAAGHSPEQGDSIWPALSCELD